MSERTPLLSASSNSSKEDILPRFIRENTASRKQKFRLVVPTQESEEALKDRFISIKLCYVGMFLSAVSFTITISSMWPFLQIIDKTTDTSFFGWIVSVFSIGQLIGSPLFGYWANKLRYHKLPLIATMLLTIFGNLLYLYLESTKNVEFASPKIWMLVSRFIIGVGASGAAVIRSYVSSATSVEERTAALANISASQGLGFIIGPVLQAALVPLGYPGLLKTDAFHLNMYTSPALLSIIIYFILTLLFIKYFNEYVVLDYNGADSSKRFQPSINSEINALESIQNAPPPDYVAIGLSLLLFFMNCFAFSFYETLSSPLTIDMYGWSKKEATFYNGLILGGFGVFAVFIVILSKILAKRFKEKDLMFAGYVILLLSIIILLPWGDDFPPVEIPTMQPGFKNTTTPSPIITTVTTTTLLSTQERRGCPLNYDWCLYTPIIKLFQFLLGFAFFVSGYSIVNVMSFAIYSKLLGPKPQGTMMGILTSFGSLARAIGPIAVSYLYGDYGPRVSLITLGSIVVSCILIIITTYKKYEPYKFS